MKSVGAFEAKTRLNELLRRVSSGETVRITRRGVPIAKLVPLQDEDKEDLAKAVQELREMRKRLSLGGLSIRKLIDEGRRY
jgi:prevent-host-death family protein